MATTLKTLKELGNLMGQGTAAQEERLMSFLANYQQANDGATPSYSVMANQLGILEEGARILVARLENKGRLHIVSRNPPRLMIVGKDTVLPHEPTAADMGLAKEGAAGRFLDAEGERMRLGRYCADYERQKGRGPSLNEMVEFVGWAKPARVQRMAEILAERGLLQYGRGVPTRLTQQERDFFGLRAGPKMEQETMEQNSARTVVVPMRKKHSGQSMLKRVNLLCKVLAERCRASPDEGPYTNYERLAVDMGYAASSGLVSDVSREAMRLGYIKDKPLRVHGLFFTEKGRAKFMPEALPQDAAPKPEITFTERVAEDSPLRAAAAEVFSMPEPTVAQVARVAQPRRSGTLDFNLTSGGISVNGSTQSASELQAFAQKLTALSALLAGE